MRARTANWRLARDEAFVREVLFTSPKPSIVRGTLVPASFIRCRRDPCAYRDGCDAMGWRKRYPSENWNACFRGDFDGQSCDALGVREHDFHPSVPLYLQGTRTKGTRWSRGAKTREVLTAIITAPVFLQAEEGIVGAAARAYVSGRHSDWRAADDMANSSERHAARDEWQMKLARRVAKEVGQ